MSIQKICSVMGKPMAENDLDFGAAPCLLSVGTPAEGKPVLALAITIRQKGQFHDDIHVSRDGMEKLLMEAAENIPTELPKTKVNGVQAPTTVKTTATTKPNDDVTTPAVDPSTDGGKKVPAPEGNGPKLKG